MANPLKEIFALKKEEFSVSSLLFGFFFLIIATFQILKPLKNGLFVQTYGADVELYAKLLNILMAMAGVTVFTFLYNRFERGKMLYTLVGFFILAFLVLRFELVNPGAGGIWAFYLLGDLIPVLMVTAFWAYLTDLSSADQAKRLFGFIAAGGVIGGWLGISSARLLLNQIGMEGLLLLASGLFVLLMFIIRRTEVLLATSSVFNPGVRTRPPGENGAATLLEGARLVFRSPYLLAILGILGFYELASQVMDYQFKLLTESLPGVVETQAFMAKVYFAANTISVVVQLFLVSILMRKFGLVTTLLVLPVALIASSAAFFTAPTLAVASLLVISDNGLNYSIQQTSRETLYVSTTPDEKYKARAFTNMFVYRFAKGVGIFAIMGLAAFGLDLRHLSLITISVLVLMVFCSVYAGRRFSRRTPPPAARRASGTSLREFGRVPQLEPRIASRPER